MGCWNHTCAVTNLPIYEHEEVEVILLKSTSFPQNEPSFCYSDSIWQPIPLTFHGTYNDYGAAENCDGAALPTILAAIRDNLFEFDVGENEYHDIEVKKEGFDADALFRADHEGRLFIKNEIRMLESPESLRVKHIVVHKDVYDTITEKTTIDWWCGRTKHKVSNLDTEQFTKDIDDLLNIDDELAKIRLMFRGVGESFTNDLLGYDGIGMIGINRPIHIIETLKELRPTQPDVYNGVLDNACRFAFFNHFMSSARKSYTVPSGVGSQDDSTKSQELCARLTLSTAKARRKWCTDNYEG